MWQLISGIFMGWSLGSNDAANIFGLAVSTKVLRFWTAAILASVFVVAGALLSGQGGFATYGKLAGQTLLSAFFISLAAAITVSSMTAFGLPVSTSQAVVGSIIGIGVLQGNVHWVTLIKVVVAWIFTPIGGAIFSYLLYISIGRLVERWLKDYFFYDEFLKVGFLLISAYSAYSLGANNVANITGVYVKSGALTPRMGALIGSLAIASGIITYSRRVIRTVGNNLVKLEPFTGFIALLGEALTLNVFAVIGVPVSASQAIVGAVLGIGLVKDVKTIDMRNVVNIILAWVLTPAISGGLAYGLWVLHGTLM